jgi:hypothetical protein
MKTEGCRLQKTMLGDGVMEQLHLDRGRVTCIMVQLELHQVRMRKNFEPRNGCATGYTLVSCPSCC